MAKSASPPAIVITIATTIARRGRSTKIAESTDSTPAKHFRRVRSHLDSRANEGQPVNDDKLASGQALINYRPRIDLTARLDTFDYGLAVLHYEDIDPFLIGNKSRLRDRHFLLRPAGFEFDVDKLPVDKRTGRIGKHGPHQNRVGGAIDLHIDEVDRAFQRIRGVIGKMQLGFDAADVYLPALRPRAKELSLTDRKTHIHRILADDDGEGTAVGADHVAFGDIGAADLSRNRG